MLALPFFQYLAGKEVKVLDKPISCHNCAKSRMVLRGHVTYYDKDR